MSTPQGKHEHPWVQPIIVAKEGSHAETILCGAKASVGLHLEPHDWSGSPIPVTVFDEWLAGPFTKTVRRGSYKDISKVLAWAEENKVPYSGHEVGHSAAFALPPMRYADLPRPIARLQVSGTDLPRTPAAAADPDIGAWVTVHVDEALTTGKATAQAAHALWKWALDTHFEPWALERFCDLGSPVALRLTGADALTDLAARPGSYPIRDAGLTEVASGTLTAVAEA